MTVTSLFKLDNAVRELLLHLQQYKLPLADVEFTRVDREFYP